MFNYNACLSSETLPWESCENSENFPSECVFCCSFNWEGNKEILSENEIEPEILNCHNVNNRKDCIS